ncbi:hypothetical protein [Dyadobacter arcticus]|uniref:EpsG family protein n=1 Tax=Dyadobacter arcticus TaxID=1078754 RepID=A0ABX0UG20_9BACT|nr:hypothetical protein [Dyadobacter arcticus]NIJ51953.1 hypothetical protein [Dyadobacter arcticus]
MSPKFKLQLSVLFILLPICFYLAYSWHYSVPIFFSDDFHLLKTVLWVQDESDLPGKFQLFTQQHNEHRIVVPRLITYAVYLIAGHISWPFLILLGNAMWCSVLWFLWKGFRSHNLALWLFIPVPLIFLQPQYYDNVTWSISILQQSVIVFWYVLLSYLCAKGRYAPALIVCVIATFTHGNGIFSFLIGILFLLNDRQWRRAGIWGLVWIAIGVLYFMNFNKGQNADFGRSLSDPGRLIASFFAFFGSISKVYFANSMMAVLIGAICFLTLAIYILIRFFQAQKSRLPLPWFDKMLAGIIIFLGITAALVSISRSWGGIETIIAPRYQHYSPFIICLVYIVMVSLCAQKFRKALGITGIVVALGFNLLSYFSYTEELIYRRNWLLADDANWVNHQNFLNYSAPFNQNINATYKKAVNDGICVSSDRFSALMKDSSRTENIGLTYVSVKKEESDASSSYLKNYGTLSNDQIPEGNVFIYLKSGDISKGYWLPCKYSRNSVAQLLSTGEWFKKGFKLEFLTENMAPGKYRVGMLKNNVFTWTQKVITIENPGS